MNQALYDSESPQGEITGTGFPDHDEFSERRDNATNSRAIQMCYPGGENPQNLHIIPGELSVGRRDGNLYATNGEPNERGFTSLSGFYWGRFRSLEAAMRYHYFQGVVKTEYMIDSAEQGEGGYTYLRAGSCSIVNNGPGDVYAGDLVQWRFPDTYRTLRHRPQGGDPHQPAGTDPSLVYGNRAGTPMTKVLVEVVRFDPMDFSTCLAATWDVIGRPPTGSGMLNNGIVGLPFTELYRKMGMTDAKNLESLQEEALGLQNSLLAIGLLLARHMQNTDPNLLGVSFKDACVALGLFDAEGRGDGTEGKVTTRKKVLRILFRPYITDDRAEADNDLYDILGLGGEDRDIQFRKALRSPNGGDADTLAVKLASDPLGMLMGAITSAQQARRSRVIGKAMSSASKSDTLHIMIGHFRNC